MQVRSIRALLFAFVLLCISSASFAQVGISITFGPPALPVYEQPLCPGDGYIWTPGYWAYDYDINDYYWVPGTWVDAPEVGFLWTPGYWAWESEAFLFHVGYWGPRVGFYGGIYYGFGYFGNGYEGGRWDNGHFFYNRSVTNVNVTVIHNVYNTTVINNTTVNRVSFNGGNGGINARPTAEQEATDHERHIPPVAVQAQHAQEARTNPQQRASVNRGKPPVAATPKPADFKQNVVQAKEAGGNYTPPPNRGTNQLNANQPRDNQPRDNQPKENAPAANRSENGTASPAPVHPRDLPSANRPTPPNTGNAKADQKMQQQQEKQFAKQEQDRQKLQQKQEKEDQKLTQQKAEDTRKQQTEQRHQQQTQQLQQKHEQQQQKLQQKQQPANRNRPEPPR